MQKLRWKFERNLRYTITWYENTIEKLQQYKVFSNSDLERAKFYQKADSTEFELAANWYEERQKMLIENKEKIFNDYDLNTWKTIYKSLNDFIDTKSDYILQWHHGVTLYAENANEGLEKLIINKELKKSTETEDILKFLYPWILGIVIAIRISKTTYQTYFID